jgi:hypothetical protein
MKMFEEESLPTFLLKTGKQKPVTRKISKHIVPQNVVIKTVPKMSSNDPFHVLNKDLALHIVSFLGVFEILKIATVR